MSINDFNQKKFIKEVRDFIKKHKLSVRKFTEMSGVAFATLYRLEEGVNEIKLSTIQKLQKAMTSYKPKS